MPSSSLTEKHPETAPGPNDKKIVVDGLVVEFDQNGTMRGDAERERGIDCIRGVDIIDVLNVSGSQQLVQHRKLLNGGCPQSSPEAPISLGRSIAPLNTRTDCEPAADVIGTREDAMRWLGKPVHALNYPTPVSLLVDDGGAEQVLAVLINLENGALGRLCTGCTPVGTQDPKDKVRGYTEEDGIPKALLGSTQRHTPHSLRRYGTTFRSCRGTSYGRASGYPIRYKLRTHRQLRCANVGTTRRLYRRRETMGAAGSKNSVQRCSEFLRP